MSELLPSWEAWAGVCRLLGRLWLRELDAATLQELAEEPLRSCFLEAGGWLPESLPPSEVPSWVQRLAEEYCRLFVGPRGHRPPVQSIWEQEQFQSEPATGMQTWWELLSWQPEPQGVQVPPDHLGLQWLTLGYLCSLCAAAQQCDPPLANEEELVQMVAAFAQQHLGWIGPACRWVANQATEPFYRHLALMTGQFLAALLKQLHQSLL